MSPMVTNVLLMVTDVCPMVAEESGVANPQKVAKIDEKWVGNTASDINSEDLANCLANFGFLN